MKLSHTETDIFRVYPKVELHRHLEGTLRIETMLEIARAHAITVPASLSGLVQVQDGVVGMDLAGNEAEFPAQPFAGILKEARQAGLQITVHAGEWAGAKNVREAIEDLGAARIGHGVRVLEDSYTTALAKERGTVFEVCVTSNLQSGVIPAGQKHPLPKMLEAGLNVTINTDDPSVSRITLSHEYRVACTELGMSTDVLKQRILAAALASFLSEKDKNDLVKSVKKELKL